MKKTKLSRQEYIAQGICPRCRKNPLFENYKLCKACKEYNRENTHKHAARKRGEWLAQGICPSCRHNLLANGKTRCDECLAASAARMEQKRLHLPDTICRICGVRPAIFGKRLCEQCQKINHARWRKWKAKFSDDHCTRCRKLKEDKRFSQCEACRELTNENRKTKRRQLLEDNLCSKCENPIEDNSPSTILCISCWRLEAARRRREHSKVRYDGQLEAIIQRDKGCIVCGQPYGIRKNAVVCHHIDGDVSNNAHSNLVMLCRKCHSVAEGFKILNPEQRQKMIAFLQKHYPY